MFSSNYERVQTQDEDDHVAGSSAHLQQPSIPDSPPPSFRSRTSSRRNSIQHGHHDEDADRNLDDAFAAPSDDEDDDGEDQSSRRLVQNNDPESPQSENAPAAPPRLGRRVTEINMFLPGASRSSGTVGAGGGSSSVNDGVFANLSAKPTRGEEIEEKPPTYEQAAADATPPYWETTILAPGAFNSDDIFVDGLLVGSLFSFVWNALISMSFQLIGFLLTYLLHTTHAAKHGSRAGLGITLIQYGFTFRSVPDPVTGNPGMPGDPAGGVPSDPNDHDFNPSDMAAGVAAVDDVSAGLGASDWISYALMIVGWFILIRAVSDFIRARRQELIVRGSPDRGLGVPVVASNETPETAV